MAKVPQRTKAQHYVPQFYLRGFTNGHGTMFRFDKVMCKSRRTSTKAAAQEENFYEIRPAPGVSIPDNMVENVLGGVENAWAPFVADLVASADAGSFSAEQIVNFAPFLVTQWIRTKTYRDTAYELIQKSGQAIIDKLVDVNFPGEWANVTLKRDCMAGIHAEKMFDASAVARMAEDIQDHFWTVGINRTSHLLYTSDHPVVRRANREMVGRRLVGLKDLGVEFAFPLDSHHLLLILERTHFAEWSKHDQKSFRLTDEQVLDYNGLQVRRSSQRVYCSNDDFELARAICAAEPAVRDPDRQRVLVEVTPIVNLKSQIFVTALE